MEGRKANGLQALWFDDKYVVNFLNAFFISSPSQRYRRCLWMAYRQQVSSTRHIYIPCIPTTLQNSVYMHMYLARFHYSAFVYKFSMHLTNKMCLTHILNSIFLQVHERYDFLYAMDACYLNNVADIENKLPCRTCSWSWRRSGDEVLSFQSLTCTSTGLAVSYSRMIVAKFPVVHPDDSQACTACNLMPCKISFHDSFAECRFLRYCQWCINHFSIHTRDDPNVISRRRSGR